MDGLKHFLERARGAGRGLVSVLDPDGDPLLQGVALDAETAEVIEDAVEEAREDLPKNATLRFRVVCESAEGMGRTAQTFRVKGRGPEKDGDATKGREMALAIASLSKALTDTHGQMRDTMNDLQQRYFDLLGKLAELEQSRREAGDEVALTKILLEYEEKKWANRLELGGMFLGKLPELASVLMTKGPAKDTNGKVKPAKGVGDVEALAKFRASITEEEWEAIRAAYGDEGERLVEAFRTLPTPRALAEFCFGWPDKKVLPLIPILGMRVRVLNALIAPHFAALHAERAAKQREAPNGS